jgi:hypothetical protein
MLLLNPLPQRLDSGATPTFAGLLAGDGTAAAPSISFASAPTNGIYYAGANEVGISNNGILRWKSTYASATNHRFQANGGGYLDATSNGAIGLVAAGTDQNITLTPSGVGHVASTSSIRSTGASAGAMTGSGIEMQFSAGLGSILAYNRTGGAYLPLFADGLRLHLNAASGGRVLIGTSTDSGALLQIGTNTTTSAGGMVFGTDTFLFRSTAGTLTLNHAAGAVPLLTFQENGNTSGLVGTSSGTVFLDARSVGGTVQIRTNGTTTALTLSSAQVATFAGAVTAPNLTVSSGVATSTASTAVLDYSTGARVIARGTGVGNYGVVKIAGTDSAGSAAIAGGIVATFDSSSGASTFAGAVIGSTTITATTQFQSDVYRQFNGNRALLSFSGVETSIGSGAAGDTTRINANGIQALRFDATLTAAFAGAVRLNNAYVAGAVVGTGYVTIQDSTGTTYRVPVLV